MKAPSHSPARDSLRIWRRWLGAALRDDARRLWRPGADPAAGFPAQALVSVTHRCDSRCTHCNIWDFYRRNPARRADEMTPAEFERFLDRNPQLIQLATTGGEQYCREDIEAFWLAMDRRGFRTSCGTNAVATDRIVAREAALLDRLSGRHLRNLGVSMDGLGETHDRVRGLRGNFDRAWRLFEWARRQESRYPFYRAEIFSTLTEDNWREYPRLVEWLIERGVPTHKLGFCAALPSPHYYGNEDSYRPVRDRDGLRAMLEALRRRHAGFGANYFSESYLAWLRDPAAGVRCRAGTAFGYVDPFWNVYPCVVRGERLGNLRDFDFDLRGLWRSPAARAFRADMRRAPCRRCFNECNRWISLRATSGGLLRIALRQARRALHGGAARRRWRL